VARLGGDEFAAGMVFDSDGALSAFLERISACFDTPVEMGQHQIPIAASVGVALFPADGDRETLLNNADLAMYRAKTSLGEHICYYQPDMDESARLRRQIASDLRAPLQW
jgi:diguanylate cyclase (GGDEF)-like protein